jgi:hypothetical protein
MITWPIRRGSLKSDGRHGARDDADGMGAFGEVGEGVLEGLGGLS